VRVASRLCAVKKRSAARLSAPPPHCRARPHKPHRNGVGLVTHGQNPNYRARHHGIGADLRPRYGHGGHPRRTPDMGGVQLHGIEGHAGFFADGRRLGRVAWLEYGSRSDQPDSLVVRRRCYERPRLVRVPIEMLAAGRGQGGGCSPRCRLRPRALLPAPIPLAPSTRRTEAA
jgi:hypothetical protein